jgi:hypothetical protein
MSLGQGESVGTARAVGTDRMQLAKNNSKKLAMARRGAKRFIMFFRGLSINSCGVRTHLLGLDPGQL